MRFTCSRSLHIWQSSRCDSCRAAAEAAAKTANNSKQQHCTALTRQIMISLESYYVASEFKIATIHHASGSSCPHLSAALPIASRLVAERHMLPLIGEQKSCSKSRVFTRQPLLAACSLQVKKYFKFGRIWEEITREPLLGIVSFPAFFSFWLFSGPTRATATAPSVAQQSRGFNSYIFGAKAACISIQLASQ